MEEAMGQVLMLWDPNGSHPIPEPNFGGNGIEFRCGLWIHSPPSPTLYATAAFATIAIPMTNYYLTTTRGS